MFAFICAVALVIWIFNIQKKLDNVSNVLYSIRQKIEKIEGAEILPAKSDNLDSESVYDDKIQESSEPICEKSSLNENDNSLNNVVERQEINKPVKTDFEIQGALLGNIFNKIGALAIIIALIIFIKLVSPFFILTDTMKVVLGFVVGLGLSFGAMYMHKFERLRNYSEVLLGTGFGVLFINTFCAYSYFHVLGGGAVLSIASILLLATFLIADKMKTLSMLIIGLVGGYVTPFLSNSGNHVIFVYLILLNILSLIFSLRNSKAKYVNIANLALSMLIFIGYSAFSKISYVYPLLLWAVYIVYDFLRDKENLADNILCYINYVLLTLFTITTVGKSQIQLGCLLGGVAFAYLLLGWFSRRNSTELYKFYDNSVLINLWLFVFFIANDLYSIIAWSLMAVIIAYFIENYDCKHMGIVLGGYCFSLFVGVLLAKVGGERIFLETYSPIVNMRTLIFGIPVLSMIASSMMLDKAHKTLSDIIKFLWVSVVYLYSVAEFNSILTKYSLDTFDNKLALYLVIGFVYALNAKKLYNTTKFIMFDIVSYFIGALSLITLVIASYFTLDFMPVVNLRLAAYLSAIVLSLYYAKSTKLEFFKYLAVFIGFFACHFEGVGIHHFNRNMLYAISLLWVLYSGAATIWGICSNKRFLINSGIVLIILSILRIFIYDLENVEPIYKLIAFLALGMILMLVSYIYNAKRK